MNRERTKHECTLRPRFRTCESTSRTDSTTTTQRKKWTRLPFLGPSSYILEKELKKLGYSVGFYPILTDSRLINTKDPIPPTRQPGVYRLTCETCNSQYIGQTGHPLSVKLSDHRTAFNKGKKHDSAMAAHCLEENHSFENVSSKLIRSCSKGWLLNRLEEVETI